MICSWFEQIAWKKEQLAPQKFFLHLFLTVFHLSINRSSSLLAWAAWANCSGTHFCKEWQEQIAQVTYDKRANEPRATEAIHKKGGKCQKPMKKTIFLQITYFLQAICLNHESITHIALFLKSIRSHSLFCKEPQSHEWITHNRSFVKSNISKSLTITL